MPVDGDAVLLEFVHRVLLDDRVELPQCGVVSDEQVSLAAQPVQHARKLDSDVPGADNSNFSGKLVQCKEII